jgi:hypothetical protein
MALAIGLDVGGSTSPSRSEPSLSLDDDGYYWFLHPLWERLRSETGQYIDLYGYAGFAGEDLAALDRILTEARQLVEAQPETWQVHVGTRISPEHRELYCQVQREAMLSMLDRWAVIIARARRLGRPVVCIAD